jgi:hypothetical protein
MKYNESNPKYVSFKKIYSESDDENRAFSPTELQNLWHTGNVKQDKTQFIITVSFTRKNIY